jgi:hypothetical protein
MGHFCHIIELKIAIFLGNSAVPCHPIFLADFIYWIPAFAGMTVINRQY